MKTDEKRILCKASTIGVWHLTSPKSYSRLLALLLLLSTQHNLFAQNINIDSAFSSINVWPHVEYFKDESTNLNIDNIRKPEYDSLFRSGKTTPNTFGYTQAAIWLRFSVSTESNNQNILLILERTSLYDAVVYQFNEDGTKKIDSIGTNIPYYQRPFPSIYCVLPLVLEKPHAVTTIYVRLRTNTSMFVPIYIKSVKEYHQQVSSLHLFYGCYVGIIALLIAYNTIIFLIRKKSIYLWYLLYIIALLLYQGFANSGLGFQYLWHDNPVMNQVLFSSLLIISMIQFSNQFLNAKSIHNYFHHASIGFMTLFAVFLLINQLGYTSHIIQYYNTTIWIVFIYLILIGVYSIKKGHPFARLYLIGWGSFILFYALFLLWLNGFIGESIWGHRALYIGSTLEMLFWFSAVADKIAISEKEKAMEKENLRKEISRDFHDELGNQIARLINYIGLLKLNNKLNQEIYETINGFTQRILVGAKDFVWALDPSNDELNNLAIHLKDFGEKMFNEKKIEFRFNANLPDSIQLPIGYSRQINLVFKEAMTNAFRHSQATNIEFGATYSPMGTIRLYLQDNGVGIAPIDINSSLRGVSNMRVRARRINGELEIKNHNRGTIVALTFDLGRMTRPR